MSSLSTSAQKQHSIEMPNHLVCCVLFDSSSVDISYQDFKDYSMESGKLDFLAYIEDMGRIYASQRQPCVVVVRKRFEHILNSLIYVVGFV